MTNDGSAGTDPPEKDDTTASGVNAEPSAESEVETDDREWRVSLSDLDDETDENKESNVAGPVVTRGPLEPGTIDRENAVFVLLGVLLIVGLLAGVLIGF
jgi:hypothetical protein